MEIEKARLAQSVERQTFNLVVVGSSPTSGVVFLWKHLGSIAQLVRAHDC